MPPYPTWFLPFLTRNMFDGNESITYALRVDVWTTTTQTCVLSGFTKSGAFSHSFVPTNNLGGQRFTFPMSEIPISISLFTPNFGLQELQTYAQVSLQINGDVAYLLAAGYINSPGVVTWPQGQIKGPLDDTGEFLARAGADPAAGAEATFTPTANKLSKPHSFTVTLVTDATAANRQVTLRIQRDGNVVYRIPAPAVQTASTTVIYCFGKDLPSTNGATALVQSIPMPDGIVLTENDTIDTVTTNLQAADNFGAPRVFMEEFCLAPPF